MWRAQRQRRQPPDAGPPRLVLERQRDQHVVDRPCRHRQDATRRCVADATSRSAATLRSSAASAAALSAGASRSFASARARIRVELRWAPSDSLRRSARTGPLDDVHQRLGGVGASERVPAGHHLVERSTPSEKTSVRRIDGAADRLLGRQVGTDCRRLRRQRCRGCGRRAGARLAASRPRRHTEVEHLGAALRGDDDRVGTEVAVEDAVRVRVGERLGDLDGELQRAARVHRPARHLLAQRPARGELVGQVEPALVLADVEQRGDVRDATVAAARASSSRRSAPRPGHRRRRHASFSATVRPTLVSRAR